MIKETVTGLMIAVFMAFLPAVVEAQFANEVKLLASDGAADDSFGYSVSISGDTAIIGAKGDDTETGSAYVFVRDPATGVWSQQQKLTASDGTIRDWFGQSVSISGDTALIGAAEFNMTGSVYVFVRNPATGAWAERQKLLASDGYLWDNFGVSVSISGDTAIIGADGDNGKAGSVYVFVRNPATGDWAERQKLLASDGVADDWFGGAVAIDGDMLIAGAMYDDDNGDYSGSAYVFARNPLTGVWTEQKRLLASDGAKDDHFGESVSISGDTAMVGASGNNGVNGTFSGSVYVYVHDPVTGDWTEQQKLIASGSTLFLGISVSVSGDLAIAGAYGNFPSNDYSGSASIFVRDSVTDMWAEQQKLFASDAAAFDWFGRAVSISGNTVITGSRQDDDNGVDSGSAYVYTAPDITVTDSVAPNDDLMMPFGDVDELASSDQTVTVTNDGSADLVLGHVAVDDALSAPFSIFNDNCSTQTLTPATSCTLGVRFSPPSVGVFSDSFDIPSDDADENPVTIDVSGSGIGVPVPDITVTDAIAPLDDLKIPFGDVTEMASSDQTVTITNDGNADLAVGDVATGDSLLAPFSILNDACSSQTLIPTANCTFTVRFEPDATGIFSDSLDIPSNDADENPVTLSVSGTGTPMPVADITVTDSVPPVDDLRIPFADLTVGGSLDQTLTVTNDGTADLVIGTIAQVGVLAVPFSVVNDVCSGQTVATAASCTLSVRFAPTTAGTFNDSFDIPSNDPDENPLTVNLSGTALAAVVNNPPTSPILVSPSDGQEGLSTTVVLQWKPSTDPDGDVVSYDVYNCMDADPASACSRLAEVALLDIPADSSANDFSVNGIYYAGLGLGGGVMVLGFTFAGGARSRQQTVLLIVVLALTTLVVSCHNGGDDNGDDNKSYVVSGLGAGTTYYWTVIAKDGNGGETPSAVRSYRTQ